MFAARGIWHKISFVINALSSQILEQQSNCPALSKIAVSFFLSKPWSIAPKKFLLYMAHFIDA